ncbi:MAG: hypothetical protein HXX81_00665 [Campylobacterales bacterium]|nr:hypothetical protein [Campylobacterales bacterium]
MRVIVLFMFFALSLFSSSVFMITSTDAYRQTQIVLSEIEIIKEHFNITAKSKSHTFNTELFSRHTWQLTYEILIKLNILRAKHGIAKMPVTSMQPTLDLSPILTYEQINRILLEIDFLKLHLGITKEPKEVRVDGTKNPTDVFNALLAISRELDLINGFSFNPSFVFAEAMRIHDDVTNILHFLKIKDDTIPPKKLANATPSNSCATGIEILKEIERLQKKANIKIVQLDELSNIKEHTPSDTFLITEFILAELQTIKAYIGMKDYVTPLAISFDGKKSEDTNQLLGWSLKKLQKIQSIR